MNAAADSKDRPLWYGLPGPEPGRPKLMPELFMDELMKAHRYVTDSPRWRGGTRMKKPYEEYLKHSISIPTFNAYLAANGIPWPLPPLGDPLYLIDGETAQVRWVSDALCETLCRERETLLLQNVGVLYPQPVPAESIPLWRLVQAPETGQQMIEHDSFLLCGDGSWLPVHQRVTYGQPFKSGKLIRPRNEVWFVHARVTGNPFRPRPEQMLFEPEAYGQGDEDVFNVDPRFIVELKKPANKAEALEIVEDWKNRRVLQMSAIQIGTYRELLKRMGLEQHHGETDG
jgi:hypothetical protein